jgi:hypothetical protein
MKQYYPDLNDLDITSSISGLESIINVVPQQLQRIPESEFGYKPSPGKWSKKEIIGHLIDSATNNHHRFIRIQYEDRPVLSYDQDRWNILSAYGDMDSNHLINFWQLYNRHLLHIIRQIPKENLNQTGLLKSGEELTLAFYINDYVKHIEHHLKEMELDY